MLVLEAADSNLETALEKNSKVALEPAWKALVVLRLVLDIETSICTTDEVPFYDVTKVILL